VALCTSCLLMGSASFAADDVSAEPPVIAGVRADQETEALLRTVEQQISTGHIISPPNDNAMETWQRVLQREIANQNSPAVLRALADFEAHVRSRAADEKAAGRMLVAAELTVFADQASRMLGHIPPSDSPSTGASAQGAATRGAPPARSAGTAASPPGPATRDASPAESAGTGASPPFPATGDASSATSAGTAASPAGAVTRDASSATSSGTAASPADATNPDAVPFDRLASPLPSPPLAPAVPNPPGADAAAAQIQTPPRGQATPGASPVTGGADTTAARPTPAAGNPVLASPVPAAPPATRPPTAREPATAVFYATRGDEMLARKDISAARKFYEYAANAGSARAATALANTFDAAFIAQLGVVGLRPDPASAAAWYRRAAALGDPNAAARLHTQSSEAPK
jgi:hypothetical protein